ncbi:stage V sporulation protein E [Gracilibacillus kekensis]|uniref:Spore cortex peptidoglycan biosynthesis regulator SpoVE n=1 Tax=Gracilibacillus kekensis TaxID=1027249 RepID=A0A1M7PDJ8_9BACI|nr:stage V sporulation protein E [Gracilibacillus kekensis]SHN15032.1 spore cortex peptidoglycan biosynthesis regulator SpoVE [Gracilibacillus kekensis]
MQSMVKDHKPDYFLIVIILAILSIGTLMVYSASSIWALYKFDDSFYFLKRQLLFAGVGVVAMFLVSNIPYFLWIKYRKWIFILCFLLLIAVLIPGIGMVRGGARSWIGVGAFSIQPAEFIKLASIMFLSGYLVNLQDKITEFKKGFLPPLFFTILIFLFIMLQPDLGTGMVFLLTCFLLIFVAGAKIIHFSFLAGFGFIGFLLLIISAPYRMNRITAFLDPWQDPLGTGFQIIQSLYAIGPGGLFGVGFGNSLQKYFYLPEPHNDFIFAIIAEELGFIGAAFVILLFFLFIWRGILTAVYAPDLFARLLAIGIVSMIMIQVMINISVVIGLIPVTGITLPFLSYGGSSLTLTLCSVGILINISKYKQ